MKNSTKDTVKFVSALVVLAVGIAIIFISLFLPPTGVIDATVLTALGELLTFVGSVWGIGEYSKVKIAQIKNIGKDEDDE